MIPRLRTLVTAAVLAAMLLIIGVLAGPPAPTLQAQSTETTAPFGWNLTPSGLQAGDRFRLLIVTSTTRDATSTNISHYDAHVQSAVASANGHTDIRSYSSGFRVLGSTETVNARDHTETRDTDTSAPIYYLNGDKVADDYAGLYDGTGWDSDVPRDESGEVIGVIHPYYPLESDPEVWTGTNSDGTAGTRGILDAYLGFEHPTQASNVLFGRPRTPGGELHDNVLSRGLSYSLYGLSEVFVAPIPPSTDATLSDLELENASNGSAITLSPGFSSGHLVYSASVGFPVSRVTVIPTTNHAGASIRYLNDIDEELGDGDRFQLFLSEGAEHFIKVEVTAESRATQTYTLTVTRAARPGEVLLSEKRLSLTEGGQRSYNVGLDRRPAANVTVTIGGHAGTNVTPNQTSLTFTPSNWSQRQWVFVSTSSDTNNTNESVTLTHTTTSTDSLFNNITGPSVIVNVDDQDPPDRHIHTIRVPYDLPLGDTALPEEEFTVWTGPPFEETIEGVAEGDVWRPSGLWGEPGTDTVWVVDPSHFGIHALKLSALKQGRVERHVAASTSDFDQRLNYRCHFSQTRASGDGNPPLTVMWGTGQHMLIANESSGTLDQYDRDSSVTSQCFTRNVTSWAADGQSYTTEDEHFKSPFQFNRSFDLSRGPLTVWGIWASGTKVWLSGPTAGVYTINLDTGQGAIAPGYDGHGDSYGLWSDGETMWVAAYGWLRAYDLDTGIRRAALDVRLRSYRMSPGDIWSDGETIWVTNRIGTIDAYRLPGTSGGSSTLRATEAAPLTAHFAAAPEAHDGQRTFNVQIAFSDDLEITPEEMRDHGLEVSGGRLTNAAPVDDRQDLWQLTIEPQGTGPVSIVAAPGGACKLVGELCTADGRPLTVALALQVAGPTTQPGKTPATPAPANSAPDAPHQPQGTAVFVGGVDLEWDDVPGADSYDVQTYRGGQWVELPGDGVAIAFYGAGAIISGLDPQASLWFQVRAANAHGVSDWSPMLYMSSTSQFQLGRRTRPANAPASGAPVIVGRAQPGQALWANTTGIEDGNGLDRVRFQYQWMSNDGSGDADIAGATQLTHLWPDADEGKTVSVRVTFIDRLGYAESLTSASVGTVAAAPPVNSRATGALTISGTAQVGQMLTADTSGITDSDGLTNVVYEYQWLADFGGLVAEISGATGSTYTLQATDEGAMIKVKVSFSDDADNPESLTSTATAVVAAPEPPAMPTGLSPSVSQDTVTLSWDAPQDDSVTGYVILRRDRAIHPVGTFVTLTDDTGSADTTYADDTVEPDKQYVYRIKAINEHGEVSEMSDWVRANTPAVPVPDTPTGLSPSVSQDAVTLTWNDPQDDSITGYVILRRDRAIHPVRTFVTLADDTGSADTTYTDATVEPDKQYVYRIKAINEHGEVSEMSDWVRANTPAAPDPAG